MASNARAQSEVLGVVLLVGLVATTATITVYIGSLALRDVSVETDGENAVQSMRQADSRLSRVAYKEESGQVVLFGGADESVTVRDDSRFVVTMNDDPACRVNVTMGSIVRELDDGRTVAYEGGGVWRTTAEGAEMVSPPDLQYRDGTVNFPMVSLSGPLDGQTNRLTATKDVAASRELARQVREELSKPACAQPQNMTVTVEQSAYYRAWGEFFEKRVGGEMTYDDDERTVSTHLTGLGEVWQSGSSNVTIQRNFSARVDVLATELSGSSWGRIYYAPINFSVRIDGEAVEPWPANPDPYADEIIAKDLNDPDKPEQWSYSFDGEAGSTVSVEATSWYAADNEWADNRTVERNGDTYYQVRPRDTDGRYPNDGERISIDSTTDDPNLVVLGDGDRVPSFEEAAPYQLGLEEILGDKIDEDGRLRLDENQAVFLYELSDPDATPEAAAGSGDPDYNDAVVLFELERAQSAGTDFHVHIAANQVRVVSG
ncbi:DUF7289 family protein [Halogeometricum luteum]|uniref:Flagellin N-terminal-like domain-containing protein n=1 Tax=Halogeometricum luteum TaxID=2950537 RepID=A0ABU2FYJ6_9EURY|nr:hypothetical protein [Halogeometricum sp. S3BR5-2]MDS0293149.1 hypothetical protein [Halogeometricum sp. S3BR5-2]